MDWTQDANMVFALLAESDHGAGNLQDSTPNNNDFTTIADGKPDWLNSSPAAGYSGGYLDFNGSDAKAYYDTTTKYFASQNMALGAWIQRDNATTFLTWAYHRDDFRAVFSSQNEAHISFIRSGGTQTNVETGSSVNDFPTGEWHHLVIVTDFDSTLSSDTKFYKDGVSDAGASGGSFTMNDQTADRSFIGSRDNASFFDGKLDEIFLYIGGLTATDVNDIYDNGLKQATGQVYNAPLFGCAF